MPFFSNKELKNGLIIVLFQILLFFLGFLFVF